MSNAVQDVQRGHFEPILEWLKDNIHRSSNTAPQREIVEEMRLDAARRACRRPDHTPA